MTHSGLQFGGKPNIPMRQEHTGLESISRQSAFGPQGDGMHGFLRSSGGFGTLDNNLLDSTCFQ